MPIHFAVMAGHANLISMDFEYFEECPIDNLNVINQNTAKKSPNRLEGNNEFKISECIRMHNEASNLNSTLILTENELLVEDDDVLGDEEGRDKTNRSKDPVVGGKPLKENCY